MATKKSYLAILAVALIVGLSSPILIAGSLKTDMSPSPSMAIRADDNFSPFAFWRNSDSLDILGNMMLINYNNLNSRLTDSIIEYNGSTLWAGTSDLLAHGNTLYAHNTNGLQVFDISDITNPLETGKIYLGYGTQYGLLALEGDYLYVPRRGKLYIFDISEPQNPVQIYCLQIPGAVMKIHIEGNRMYCGMLRSLGETAQYPALLIYDISNPGSPSIVGKYETPLLHKDCRVFTKYGDYIYSINFWEGYLEIISVIDETRPIRIDAMAMQYPISIALYQHYLYVGAGEIKVYDLTLPESPQLLYAYDVTDYAALETSDGRLYSFGENDDYGMITMYDIASDGSLDSVGFCDSRYFWYSLKIRDSLLFIPEGYRGFSIADASNPDSCSIIGSFSHDNYKLMGLDIGSEYLYLSNRVSFTGGPNFNGIYVVDIEDPADPRLINFVEAIGNPCTIFVTDSLAFLPECQPTNIYSLADPANPVLIAEYPPDNETVRSNYVLDTILIASKQKALDFVDIRDPANPALIAVDSALDRDFYHSFVVGNLAYVTCFGYGFSNYLRTYDIADITAPVLLHELYIERADPWGQGTALKGSYLFFAARSKGLYTIDLSNPIEPDIAARHYPPENNPLGEQIAGDNYKDVVIIRNYMIVSAVYSLQVFDITDPLNLQIRQFIPLSSDPYEMEIRGDYLYVACKFALLIFKLNLPELFCGDANTDGLTNISDAVFIINYIFADGWTPDPLEIADVNCDTTVNVSDAVWIINYIFVGGNIPCDINGDTVPDC